MRYHHCNLHCPEEIGIPLSLERLIRTLCMHFSALSEVFWETIEILHEKRSALLLEFRYDIMEQRREEYARALDGLPSSDVVVFIDCTKIQIARPSGSAAQRSFYSGYKRFHCFSYQTISTPDGLIFHLYGPEEGGRHDSTLYRKNNMNQYLE